MSFTHLDLFAGIGGFSRAVSWLGGTTVAFVEWEAWNRRVLAKHWPHARFFGDIHEVGADELSGLGRVDIITGGYPCQPFSQAGKRLGAADDRHLWPEMRRVVDLTRPTYILAENVAGHVTMGLDTVLADLEEDGYACGAVVVPACAVNALHRRDRVWIMAHRNGSGSPERRQRAAAPSEGRAGRGYGSRGDGDARQVAIRGAGQDTGGMAHAESVTEREPGDDGEAQRDQRHARLELGGGSAGQPEREAEPGMADSAARGLRRGRASGHERQPALGGEGAAVGHADEPRLEGRQQRGQCAGERPTRTAGGESVGTNGHETLGSVDPRPDGVPARLVRRPAARSAWDDPDMIRAMWADGSWERDLPRVVAEEVERRQKLQAAGNAIVPLVAYEILSVMLGGAA